MARSVPKPRVLIYLLRRDIRLSDNPIFHYASLFSFSKDADSKASKGGEREDFFSSNQDGFQFTHLLPVYIFPANQIEVSGFIQDASQKSPYGQAKSRVAKVWRTGSHRAKFTAEGVWDLKEKLEGLGCGSGLEVRVGMIRDVVKHMMDWYAEERDEEGNTKVDVAGIWMTSEEGTEEKDDERHVRRLTEQRGVDFKLWKDEKYYVDDDDQPFEDISDLPNVYTTYRKSREPLRERPRPTLPTPKELPPIPPDIPPQHSPFKIASSLTELKNYLLKPLLDDPSFGLRWPPQWPSDVQTAHPFTGGERAAQERLSHLITSGSMTSYKATRNGMLGLDYSTKLSAFLSQGHITARQIHWAMLDFEQGRGQGKDVQGYGKGENDGTAGVRFELLWRDYMRLCQRKFGAKMFDVRGIRAYPEFRDEDRSPHKHWKYLDKSGGAGDDPTKTREAFERFRSGRTGMGLIDAANRELFLTGYMSNRARQNAASFLALHLGIDWRLGAEWFESLLIDYDVGNNWGNWQYVAGVGNDPRQGRVFNPVKQALDYDKQGEFIKAWVPELRGVQVVKKLGSSKVEEVDQQRLMGLYQAWRLSEWEKEQLSLKGVEWVEKPLVRIQFSITKGREKDGGRGKGRGKGRGGGNWRSRSNWQEFRRLGNQDKALRAQSADVDPAAEDG